MLWQEMNQIKISEKIAEPEQNPTHKYEETEPNRSSCITIGNWHHQLAGIQ